MSTYGQILTQVQANCGGRDNDEFLAAVMFNTNMILRWLATQADWLELQKSVTGTLVVGQQEYTKAQLVIADVSKIYNIQLQVSSMWRPPLPFVPSSGFNTRFGYTSNSEPSAYTIFAGKYKFSCPPNLAYPVRIEYYAKPTLVTELDSPIPYEDLDGPIACLVSGFGWLGEGDGSVASVWFKQGAAQLQALGVDVTSIMNFSQVPRSSSSTTGTPWLDPFTRSS